MTTSLTVIVVTLNRSDCVQRCLACLSDQTHPVQQVIVVDASTDAQHRAVTQAVVADRPGVYEAIYLRNEAGYGHMTMSRNIGLERATGEIIAFLDDDSFARPDWAANLLATYANAPDIGGVGGRAVRCERQLHDPIDEQQAKIGVLRRDGMIGGAWTVDCGRPLEVEHLQGCNMSFRRCVLAELGGFRDEYRGPEVREETDLCLRVRRLGHRLVYAPKAVVIHIGAPKPQGRRFDHRYEYFARHNHVYLLIRNFGCCAMLARYLISSLGMDLRLYGGQAWRTRGLELPQAISGFAVTQYGKVIGLYRGGVKWLSRGLDPLRQDQTGRALRHWLNQSQDALSGSHSCELRTRGSHAVAEACNT